MDSECFKNIYLTKIGGINLSEFDEISILYIVLSIILAGFLLRNLYTVCHHGKIILKLNKNSSLSILWVIVLIIWAAVFLFEISNYINYGKGRSYNTIFMSIVWIEISITNIITSLRKSEIRENGIYNSGRFYKWSKIKSYSWILSNTIQVNANAFWKLIKALKL